MHQGDTFAFIVHISCYFCDAFMPRTDMDIDMSGHLWGMHSWMASEFVIYVSQDASVEAKG